MIEGLKRAWALVGEVQRRKATGAIEAELTEHEAVFALLVLGGLGGHAAPPLPICLELLPDLEREVTILLSRSADPDDALSRVAGVLGVDL